MSSDILVAGETIARAISKGLSEIAHAIEKDQPTPCQHEMVAHYNPNGQPIAVCQKCGYKS